MAKKKIKLVEGRCFFCNGVEQKEPVVKQIRIDFKPSPQPRKYAPLRLACWCCLEQIEKLFQAHHNEP